MSRDLVQRPHRPEPRNGGGRRCIGSASHDTPQTRPARLSSRRGFCCWTATDSRAGSVLRLLRAARLRLPLAPLAPPGFPLAGLSFAHSPTQLARSKGKSRSRRRPRPAQSHWEEQRPYSAYNRAAIFNRRYIAKGIGQPLSDQSVPSRGARCGRRGETLRLAARQKRRSRECSA